MGKTTNLLVSRISAINSINRVKLYWGASIHWSAALPQSWSKQHRHQVMLTNTSLWKDEARDSHRPRKVGNTQCQKCRANSFEPNQHHSCSLRSFAYQDHIYLFDASEKKRKHLCNWQWLPMAQNMFCNTRLKPEACMNMIQISHQLTSPKNFEGVAE